MADHEARRTLVKSAPELWVECSDAGSLARHLGAFGEIRVTRLEPETTVAWEGDAASGTVSLEPAGWGTRVILTAVTPDPATDTGLGVATGPEAALALAAAERAAAEPAAGPGAPGSPEPDGPRPRSRAVVRLLIAIGRHRRTQAAPAAPPMRPQPVASERESAVDSPAAPPPPGRRRAKRPAVEDPAARALAEALDSLGRAHHRPYSRA